MMLISSFTQNLWLTTFLVFFVKESNGDNAEYAPVDGFRNNIGQPTSGIAGSNFVRASPPAYSDGAYNMGGKDRPHPMEISLKVHAGRSGQASLFSRNSLQAFYAQLVLDEVAMVTPGCPPEYENLQLPSQHPFRNLTKRPQVYQRSLYDQSTGYLSGSPRQQINLASSFLDGGIIYGTSKTWTSLLRSYSGGRLLADTANITSSFPAYNDVGLPLFNSPIPRDHEMKPVDRLFRLGNGKGHENPFLLALQVIWFRWHNKVAGDVAATTARNLTDEEIFQKTKKMVVAHFQKILVKDWLPAFLYGNLMNATMDVLPTYTNYSSRQHPGVTHELLAAMDFRHTITPAAVWNLKFFTRLHGSGESPLVGAPLSRGWGDNINWLTLDAAFKKAKQDNVPVMVIIHKMTCGACIYQKRWFSRSNVIQSMAKNLAMVNLEIGEVPKGPEFTPDGYYVPRILFFSPYGKLLPDVNFKYNQQYKFNYPQEHYLASNMKYVIDEYRPR